MATGDSTLYFTRDYLITRGINADDEIVSDAARVRDYIATHEGIGEHELRQYGERNGLDPDRINRALQFLHAVESIITIGVRALPDDTPLRMPPEETKPKQRRSGKKKDG